MILNLKLIVADLNLIFEIDSDLAVVWATGY